MDTPETKHLDSRRGESGEGQLFGDFEVDFTDAEAMETSPFREDLEGLRQRGFTKLAIGHPDHDLTEWWVTASTELEDTDPLIAHHLGGKMEIRADISEDGDRQLQVSFGGGDLHEFDTKDLHEMAWEHLEKIREALEKGEGRGIPIPHEYAY